MSPAQRRSSDLPTPEECGYLSLPYSQIVPAGLVQWWGALLFFFFLAFFFDSGGAGGVLSLVAFYCGIRVAMLWRARALAGPSG